MSTFDELADQMGEDATALVSLDIEDATYVTRGAIGTGTWYREPCGCDNPECPAQEGGNFKIISLLMEDVDGNEITIVIPAESQFAGVLTDYDTFTHVRDALEA